MKKIRLISSALMIIGLKMSSFAQGPNYNCDPLELNSIAYIEESIEIDLGFDTAAYLPDGFDPYELYVDLNAISFIEAEENWPELTKYLPSDFEPYANPSYFRSVDYIDPSDDLELDFNTSEYLPEGFDPYKREAELNNFSL